MLQNGKKSSLKHLKGFGRIDTYLFVWNHWLYAGVAQWLTKGEGAEASPYHSCALTLSLPLQKYVKTGLPFIEIRNLIRFVSSRSIYIFILLYSFFRDIFYAPHIHLHYLVNTRSSTCHLQNIFLHLTIRLRRAWL